MSRGKRINAMAVISSDGLLAVEFTTHTVNHEIFLPRPAGSEATCRAGPKIVLDHVHVYICINYVCALTVIWGD